MGKCETYCKGYGPYANLVFRLLFGLMFFLHGWGKFASGMPAGTMLVAGIIEVVVGAAVFLGLFTRVAAGLGAVEMLVAYFMAHAGNGWNPLANGGELALLYFAGFLALAVLGNGKWNLEEILFKKELF